MLLNGELWVPYDIAVSATDENIIWAARTSQYGNTNLDGRMIFKSTNGGMTWAAVMAQPRLGSGGPVRHARAGRRRDRLLRPF